MLVNLTPIKTGDAAGPNLWNERYAAITAALNGNIDSDNLKDGGVTTSKLANGAVTSEKLGFEQFTDDNGWTITDLGLVKLAAKRRTFKVPATPQGTGQFAVMDAGMDTNPVGFNINAPHRVIHLPYMLGVNHAVGPWDLKMKEEDGVGFMKPNTKVVATRLNGGTSAANEPGAVESWVIF